MNRIIEKIKKCLRLAKSSNPHEAAAALRQAQKLMAEHDISEEAIAASEANEAPGKSSATDKPTMWEVMLANMVGAVFGCDIVFSRAWIAAKFAYEGQYNFIGVGAQAEIAAYAFAVLRRQAAKARREYTRSALKRCSPAAKVKRADQFSIGWVASVRQLAVALARDERSTAIVAAFTTAHYPHTTSIAPRERQATPLAYRDHQAGREEGRNARLHAGVGAATPAGLLT